MPAPLSAYRPAVAEERVPLLRRDHLPPAAWTGMLLDGAIVPLWGGVAICAGHETTAALRLAALSPLVPRRGVVGRAAAAWVHAGGAPPDKVDVVVPPGVRRANPHPRRRAAEGPLPDDEVLDLGTGRVTTVLRTGLDVARYLTPEDAGPLLVRLLAVGFDPDRALAALDAVPGERGVLRARAVLGSVGRGEA